MSEKKRRCVKRGCRTILAQDNTDEYCDVHRKTKRTIYLVSTSKKFTRIIFGDSDAKNSQDIEEAMAMEPGEKIVFFKKIKVSYEDYFKVKEAHDILLEKDLHGAILFELPKIIFDAVEVEKK